MKPQSCKAKGRRLQQFVVRELLELFPELTEDDVRSTSMGASGEDVQLSSAARRLVPYSFEAKNQERLNVWTAMAQARANTPAQCDPVVVLKKNGEKPHVLVSWDVFRRALVPAAPPTAPLTPREELEQLSERLRRVAGAM